MKAQPIIFPPSSDLTAKLAVLAANPPVALHALGNPELLTGPTLALFCSAKAPARVILQIHDLAQRWRVAGPTIIGGFHSPAEQEALVVLLRGPQPVILCPARSLARMRLKPEYRTALAEGRLLLLSSFAETVRRATIETAVRRNRFVAALADRVLIAYADPGGKTRSVWARWQKATR